MSWLPGCGVGKSRSRKFCGGPNASITTAFMPKSVYCQPAELCPKRPACANNVNLLKVMLESVQPSLQAMNVLHEIVSDGVMVVTLNRPEKLNALDIPSKEQLGSIWQNAADNPQIR